MFVPAPAEAATHSVDATVVGPLAVSVTAPAGSFSFACGGGRYGSFTYSNGSGSTLGGLVLSCGTATPSGPPPLTTATRMRLHILGGTGAYAGAGGLGELNGLVAYGGPLMIGIAVGSLHFDVTTP
jgi:hypothetical protein